jgi:hypothetical protein
VVNWLRRVLDVALAGLALTPVRTAKDRTSRRAGRFGSAPHDVRLIGALESDHRKLLSIHEQIGRLKSERRYTEIPVQLVALRTRLESHMLTENVRLYAFLEHRFQGDFGRLAQVAEFRADANALLLAVLKFVKHHRRTTFDESRLLSFVDEHRHVGELLAKHSAREERHLYRLYPLI